MQKRFCGKCSTEKELTEFHKDKSKKFGVSNTCKECAKAVSRAYYKKNTEGIKRRVAGYRVNHVPRFHRDIYSRLKTLCTSARLRKNKEFDIIPEDLYALWDKQKGLCAYTGLPLTSSPNQLNTASLDRIDSSRGYFKDNIHLVSWAANKMKQDLDEGIFFQMACLIATNNSLKESPESFSAQFDSVDHPEQLCTLDNPAP